MDGTVGRMSVDDRAPTPSADRRRRLRPGVVIAAVLGVSVLGMWAWVLLYHLGGSWREDMPGRLGDATFPIAAEPVCAAAAATVASLPPAWVTDTPAARADAVDESVEILAAMVADLRQLPPGSDAGAVTEWLNDWDTYVADRADYAARLRTDPQARFYVTQSDRDRRQITLAIDRFATTNGMPSCVTPADLS